MAVLVNARWVDIPEDRIYQQLNRLSIRNWSLRSISVAGYNRNYLFGGQYAYPYSLPAEVINRLAQKLNEALDMTWYKEYNQKAMAHFTETGEALNQAQMFWFANGDFTLPKPTIKPVDGLEDGDPYIAIIGLFHLTGEENSNNHNLYIDLIDEDGFRIYDHVPNLALWYGWEGQTAEEVRATQPVRIDKPDNEPGANIGIVWGQIIYGFHINNIATDRFSGIHIQYENTEPGNNRGHHSHYIVLQKRIYRTKPPEPEEPQEPEEPRPQVLVMTIDKDWLDRQPVEDGVIKIYADKLE